MIRIVVVALSLYPVAASAEFYVWHDGYGIKHVSTHPRDCIEDSRLNQLKAGCAPLTLSKEGRLHLDMKGRRAAALKEAEAFEKECAALKLKVSSLSKGIEQHQASFSSRVLSHVTDGGSLPGLDEMITLPMKLGLMQREMLAADKAFDKCVPESERAERKEARNSIRRRTAANVRQAQQRNELQGIRSELRNIKNGLMLY